MRLPDGTRGRLLAIALIVLPTLVLLQFVIRPLSASYAELTEGIAEAQREIPRYQRLIAERPALEAAAARLQRDQASAGLLLPGANPALAAAELQRLLQEIAQQHGVSVLSIRVEQPTADGPLQRVSVQARLQADGRGLRDTLYGLEAARPWLFVDALSITTRGPRRGAPADALEIRLTLSGLRVPDATTTVRADHG